MRADDFLRGDLLAQPRGEVRSRWVDGQSTQGVVDGAQCLETPREGGASRQRRVDLGAGALFELAVPGGRGLLGAPGCTNDFTDFSVVSRARATSA